MRDEDKDSCDTWCHSLMYWTAFSGYDFHIRLRVLPMVLNETQLAEQFKGQPKLIYKQSETDGKFNSFIEKCQGVQNTLGIFWVETDDCVEPYDTERYFGAFTTIPWSDDEDCHSDLGKSFIFKVDVVQASDGKKSNKIVVYKHLQGEDEVFHCGKPSIYGRVRSGYFYNFAGPIVKDNKTVKAYLSDWYEC